MSIRNQTSLFVSLEGLVKPGHPYRCLEGLVDFDELSRPLASLYSNKGRKELGAARGFKSLVLQFMEDLSDREMERYLEENTAAKWFCEFGLEEKTPDHSYFGDYRKRLGTSRLMALFERVRESLKQQGVLSEVFTFVDASQLISKLSTWDDRDKAIQQKLETFNNQTASKVAAEPQARFGCKGKDKHWYGYKEHVSVDMQSGLINKVAATPANVTDAQGLKHICPSQGAVYGDKGYCVKPAQRTLKRKGCHDGTIKKNNMKAKNRDKDRWLTKIRAPYERVFSKRNKRVRYKGTAKVQFQVGLHAFVFNCKRLLKLDCPHVELVPVF